MCCDNVGIPVSRQMPIVQTEFPHQQSQKCDDFTLQLFQSRQMKMMLCIHRFSLDTLADPCPTSHPVAKIVIL